MPPGFPPKGFLIHLTIFAVVMLGLAVLNIARDPEHPWFLWVLVLWGLGVAGHGFLAYRRTKREADAAIAVKKIGQTKTASKPARSQTRKPAAKRRRASTSRNSSRSRPKP
ncbi:2TM domain-containing protein [Methyloligella sp. 2.7D]|uniref:2TM domain-containing protein n=1 Tax=unclassified Methyloligella TaxID=2625955 RepID=UPI00157CDA14|nr:2TM domain-containing protein [Methyloligella sp. GL2]QKP76154.1 2TM domain-containing protein [Methyloligella sp. GL2]